MIPSCALLAVSSPLRVTKVRVLFTFSGQKKESYFCQLYRNFERKSRNRKINFVIYLHICFDHYCVSLDSVAVLPFPIRRGPSLPYCGPE